MIVHISPGEDDVAETICSLSFAKRVRAIEANVSEVFLFPLPLNLNALLNKFHLQLHERYYL